jgi:hypothetical protein
VTYSVGISVKIISNFIALQAICLVFCSAPVAKTIYEISFDSAQAKIGANAHAAKISCESMAGITKDVCIIRANGKARISRAELDEIYSPSPRTHYLVLAARIDAEFSMAYEQCKVKVETLKDICRLEAISKKNIARKEAKTNFKFILARNSEARRQDARTVFAKDMCNTVADSDRTSCFTQALVQMIQH